MGHFTKAARHMEARRLGAILVEMGRVQAILSLKVSPGLDYVDFSFRTSQATVPIITVSTGSPDVPPGAQVASAIPFLKRETRRNTR